MGSQPRGISASRGAAVLGLSEFATPLSVWQEIMEERRAGFNAQNGYVLPERPDNAALRFGLAFESAVIELAQMERRSEIKCREWFYSTDGADRFCDYGEGNIMPSKNYCITCHIDGKYCDNLGVTKNILHEGKTTSAMVYREKWGQAGTDHIPRSYQVQVQHQMLCTGAEEAVVSVLVFPETPDKWEKDGWKVEPIEAAEKIVDYRLIKYVDGKADFKDVFSPWQWAEIFAACGYFHQYPVRANSEAQKLMLEAYRDFWHNHVLTGKPPEPRNYEDVKRLMPEPKTTIIVPDYIERKIAEYSGIVEETAGVKKRKERLKTIITKYAVDHTGGVMDDDSADAVIFRNSSGDKLGSWQKQKDGRFVFRT